MVLVACGWRHTISVSSSGGLYTYGWSKYGQLGHGDCEDHLVPRKLEALSDKLISQVVHNILIYSTFLLDMISAGCKRQAKFYPTKLLSAPEPKKLGAIYLVLDNVVIVVICC